MKRYFLTVMIALAIGTPALFAQETTNTNAKDFYVDIVIKNDVAQAQQAGGNEGRGNDEYETATTMNGPGVSPHYAPGVLYDPSKNRETFNEVRSIRFTSLYHDLDKLIKIMKQDGDIFQSPRVAYTIGENEDDIEIITKIPMGDSDIELFNCVIDSPTNGNYRETIIRGASFLKMITGTRRILVSQLPLLTSFNESGAWATNNGMSKVLDGLLSSLASGGYTTGDGAGIAYQRAKIYFYAYNDTGNKTTANTFQVPQNALAYFEFGSSGIPSELNGKDKVGDVIFSKWDKTQALDIIAYGPLGSELLNTSAYNAMINIGQRLVELGISPNIVAEKLHYDASSVQYPSSTPGAVACIVVKPK